LSFRVCVARQKAQLVGKLVFSDPQALIILFIQLNLVEIGVSLFPVLSACVPSRVSNAFELPSTQTKALLPRTGRGSVQSRACAICAASDGEHIVDAHRSPDDAQATAPSSSAQTLWFRSGANSAYMCPLIRSASFKQVVDPTLVDMCVRHQYQRLSQINVHGVSKER